MPGGHAPAMMAVAIVASLASLATMGFVMDGAEANPAVSPAASISDREGGFAARDGADGIAIAEIYGRIYAVITASRFDNGVQIIDITIPTSPAPAAAISDGAGGFTMLDGADGIAIAEIYGRTYAVITASRFDNGVQIIDITIPTSPAPAAAISDGAGGFTMLDGADGVAIAEISGRTYAVITAGGDSGVQIIDITIPTSPVPIAAVTGGVNGFAELDEPGDIAIAEIYGRTYAVVVARHDDGVQIMDITVPASPVPAAAISDEAGGFTTLDTPRHVAIAEIYGRTYAVITAGGDSGVQIIDITVPTSPVPVAAVTDGVGGFATLDWAGDVAIAEISGRTYAVVAAWNDNGVQIIDITIPTSPIPVVGVTASNEFPQLGGPDGVTIVQTSGRTYAVVAGSGSSDIQVIDITDPSAPSPVAGVPDDLGDFARLGGASSVATTEISGRTYAVVTAWNDGGVQIIDIADIIDLRPTGATITGAHSRDGTITLAVDLDVYDVLRHFAVTISCGGAPTIITGMDADVSGWLAHLAAFSEFDLTFVDGSRDDTPDVRIGFNTGGTLADAAYPISFSGADLLVSGTLPYADSALIRMSYETADGSSCDVKN